MSSVPVLMEACRVHTRNPGSATPVVRPTHRKLRCRRSYTRNATVFIALSNGSDSCDVQVGQSLTRQQLFLGSALSLGTLIFGGESHAYELSCQGLKAYDMQKCLKARREAQEAEVRRGVTATGGHSVITHSNHPCFTTASV